ncbi:General transcription factor IIH subunit 2 [Phytophthora cinnamomi]|uniref:General transcription factor IIH subunit 2 n=1 Tax=Phytophthora cinnamomi TaxID=4785 RepID=UPI003559E681|nr:General transcription factor IIH subunit 2 [Phytophthora cinnamomi]
MFTSFLLSSHMEEEASTGYAWEGALERSWDVIEEDASGNLKIDQAVKKQQRQRRLEIARNVRKGLIRYTYVVMDLSRGMATKDWKPHRLACASGVLQQFVKDYFDQNPISQLGVIGIKGMTAEKLSDLSGNPKTHMERIAAALAVDKEPSLQNALEIAKSSLKTVPAYGSREVVVVYGNLVTADPGDIFQTLAALKRENIRVSFIGIGAEMHLLRRIADGTDGTYHVAVDAEHMKRLMTAFTFPSPTVATAASRFATLVEMGFPQRRSGALSLCTCHQAFTTVGYLCPRCKSKSCDLPTTCQVCNLPLVSSPHLARSYHHLFPVAKFTQHLLRSGVTGEKGAKVTPSLVQKKCFGCLLPLGLDGEGTAYECTTCQNVFCSECDMYVHDSLHNCPGCS